MCSREMVWDQSPFSLSCPRPSRWLFEHPRHGCGCISYLSKVGWSPLQWVTHFQGKTEDLSIRRLVSAWRLTHWEGCWQGRDPWPPPSAPRFCPNQEVSHCPQGVASHSHSWPLSGLCPPPGTLLPLLLCPFGLCILPGASPHPTTDNPQIPCPHSSLSTVSPQTVCANHFGLHRQIIFCLLIVSIWIFSLQLRQEVANVLPSLTPPPLLQSLP